MRRPWSLFGLLLLGGGPLLAAEPAKISSVDPLEQPPPVLDRGLVLETSPVEPEDKIVPSLRERLATAAKNEPVRVIVTLVEPRSDARSGPPEEADRLLARRIAALAHRFARSARAVGFAPERGLSHLPIVIGRVAAADVGRLAALPEVRAIEEVVQLRAARVEGGRLVRAPDLRERTGAGGAGVGVAVLDTGIDAEHPELTGLVGVEADFTGTTGSGAVDDNGHGTAVAGIVAGRGGGMAPEATLWAIKVLDAEGEGDSAQTLAALDALYANRNDFGGLHVLNLSLVTSAFGSYETCDPPFPPGQHFPAEALALSKLLAAGVTTFAASGNNGRNAVSFPACLSSAIAVGAVYDADLGATSFPGLCADPATRAD
ncbi:MAG TPA: S8 family serine peptidase, partial [Thermoanaerobaculia bacterium]|nr:S8 family serine peptidase [Thermoanaerobaculia bacterium]